MTARMPAARGKRDANQAAIVATLEACMCTVVDLGAVGFGCGDLLVGGMKSWTALAEIKTQDGDLNEAQQRFHRDWRGSKIWLLRSEDDAIAMVKAMNGRYER